MLSPVAHTGDCNIHRRRAALRRGILSVPDDENAWSSKLRVYFKAIQQFHARPRETALGEVMVTNLSSFPSALTVISVPDGDIRKHRQEFIVNENLKRLGCSGRSGMTLSEPSTAAKAKFLQLYKTYDKIPFTGAVLELVKLCQVALFIFGKLDQEYIDGLLCDVTETAVGDWWTDIGADYYNIEPTDGILGPTTVVALIGLLMGARNRLSYINAPVSKDVFDIDATKRGIGYFQKYQRLERTRRLDRQTLHKLHTATAKAAAGEGWGVQKAVKSTVSEIGGKRGEIVLGMVSGRDKGGIGDIETLDLDKFMSLAQGERAKWLWFGKPKRQTLDREGSLPDLGNMLLSKDAKEELMSKRAQSLPLEEEVEMRRREEAAGVYATPAPGSAISVAESPGDKDALRRNVFRGITDKMSDARSGVGRIKDAVFSGGGLRGHSSRLSKDENSEASSSGHPGILLTGSSAGLVASPSANTVTRAFTWKNKPEEYKDTFRKEEASSGPSSVAISNQLGTIRSEEEKPEPVDTKQAPDADERESAVIESSIAGSTADERDLLRPIARPDALPSRPMTVYRRHSFCEAGPSPKPMQDHRWPRRLSFSEAEDVVLRWYPVVDIELERDGDDDDDDDAREVLQGAAQQAELLQQLYNNATDLGQRFEPWVEAKLKAVEAIDDDYSRQQEELQLLYYQLTEAYQQAKDNSQELIASERAHVTEATKEVEVLVAKLEYEINALVSRVQDVEDGAAQFEVQVKAMERQAEELKVQLETESWLHWAVRTVTGIGTGPNITRSK
jgi:hypothetical protein